MKFLFYYAMSSFVLIIMFYISLPGVKYYWQMMHTIKRLFLVLCIIVISHLEGKKCAYN